MATQSRTEGTPGDVAWLFLSVGILTLLALMGTGMTEDPAFRFHGYILMAAGVLALSTLTLGVANGHFRSDPSKYADGVIRAGVIATTFWGIVGMTVGVLAAAQLAWPNLFYFPEHGWLNFGRIRPLHTSGVIFAFGGNALIATSFWVVQRTCKARLFGGILPWFVFWGYQLFIVLAATGYVAGITQSREYAEPEWYVDLWLTIVWVAYLLVFLGTIWKRKEPHIYVANWFYLAFIVTIALLHVVEAGTASALPAGRRAVFQRFHAMIVVPARNIAPPRTRMTFWMCLAETVSMKLLARKPSGVYSRHIRPSMIPETHIEVM